MVISDICLDDESIKAQTNFHLSLIPFTFIIQICRFLIHFGIHFVHADKIASLFSFVEWDEIYVNCVFCIQNERRKMFGHQLIEGYGVIYDIGLPQMI